MSSPFVKGILKPRIYLPYGIPENEKIYIVWHETIHIRHGDPWFRLLGMICLCLHWWNPLVWLGIHEMLQDMEMYCDEVVLEKKPISVKKKYSDMLLRFALGQSGFSQALFFGESNTEKRVKNILREKKNSALLCLLIPLFVGLCTYAFLTVPQKTGEEAAFALPEEETSYVPEEIPVSEEEVPVFSRE